MLKLGHARNLVWKLGIARQTLNLVSLLKFLIEDVTTTCLIVVTLYFPFIAVLSLGYFIGLFFPDTDHNFQLL